MQHLILFTFTTLLLLTSCDKKIYTNETPQEIVVEGWIDAGGYPIVMLSKSIPISSEWQSFENLDEYIIKWGKVTVSDGEKEVVLTGKYDSDYYPPYIYTTTEIQGVAGKKYKLMVSYNEFYAEAETTIPEIVELEAIYGTYSDNKYILKAKIDDNPNEHNYYKFFARVIDRDNMYLSSNIAVINDADYNFPAEIPIEIGSSMLYDKHLRDFVLTKEHSVRIKFAAIDSVAYTFWNDYKNVVEISRNSMFRYNNNIHSNIKGGLGYWFGYGATEYLCLSNKHNEPIKISR